MFSLRSLAGQFEQFKIINCMSSQFIPPIRDILWNCSLRHRISNRNRFNSAIDDRHYYSKRAKKFHKSKSEVVRMFSLKKGLSLNGSASNDYIPDIVILLVLLPTTSELFTSAVFVRELNCHSHSLRQDLTAAVTITKLFQPFLKFTLQLFQTRNPLIIEWWILKTVSLNRPWV